MELLSQRSDTQRSASSWKVVSVGPVDGPARWSVAMAFSRFSLNQLVIPDSTLPETLF